MWTSKIHVVMPAHHPLAGCDVLEWNYLISEHFIFSASGDEAQRYRRLINSQKKRGRPSTEYFEVSHGMLLRLVALGFGLSMIGETYVPPHCADIASRPLIDDGEDISYYAVWLPGNDNPALRRFLSLARSMSAKKPAPKA
jgi:DNA-binding transcriptional LysR family regulator